MSDSCFIYFGCQRSPADTACQHSNDIYIVCHIKTQIDGIFDSNDVS